MRRSSRRRRRRKREKRLSIRVYQLLRNATRASGRALQRARHGGFLLATALPRRGLGEVGLSRLPPPMGLGGALRESHGQRGDETRTPSFGRRSAQAEA